MTLINVDGFEWVNRASTDDWIAIGDHEPEVTALLSECHGDTFIDIGAHVGRYTVRCARNFKTVWAWEPGYHQREGLTKHLQLNRVNNVIVVPFAAWDHSTILQYTGEPEKDGQGRVLPEGERGYTLPISVYGRRVDQVVWGRVDLVKIDVEGSEVQVLEGMTRILSRHLPALYIEIHNWIDPTLGDRCREVLQPFGYAIREFEVHGQTYWEARC